MDDQLLEEEFRFVILKSLRQNIRVNYYPIAYLLFSTHTEIPGYISIRFLYAKSIDSIVL